ncbi:hypothetical protein B0H13DRAFT_2400045 [Mycena leptocephala]|nr:hypothetical protein B0H13DRAFT_2400045 [Mycena leptocephala]
MPSSTIDPVLLACASAHATPLSLRGSHSLLSFQHDSRASDRFWNCGTRSRLSYLLGSSNAPAGAQDRLECDANSRLVAWAAWTVPELQSGATSNSEGHPLSRISASSQQECDPPAAEVYLRLRRHSAHHLMHCACGATELGDLQACTTIEVAGTPGLRACGAYVLAWQLTLGPFTTTLSGVYEQLGSSGAEVVSSVCVLPYRVFSFKKTRDRSAATPCTPASCQDSASGGSGPIHVASKDDRGRKRCCTTERDVGSSRPLAPARARPCRAGKSLPYALLFSAPLPYSDGPQRRFGSVSVRFTSFYSLLHLA